MEVLIILAVVGVGYLLLQKQGLGVATSGPSAAQISAQMSAQQHNLNLQLQGINLAENAPNTGLAYAEVGTQAGLQAGESFASSAARAGSAVGSAVSTALPIVGTILGIGLSLLGQHTARVKGATAENSGIDAIVPAFDADLKEINAAYRAGSINASMAVSYLSQVVQQYWSYMGQFQGRPGVAIRSCPPGQVGGPIGKGGCTSGQPICDKGCTAGCCVGCSAINGSIANCIWAVQTGYHGPVAVCAIFGGKFGSHDRAGYTLSW